MSKRRRTDNTMSKRQQYREHNVQKTEVQTTQCPKEGQTTQCPKEEGQTTQWPKEEGQTTQWPKEEGQTTQCSKEEQTLHRKLKTEKLQNNEKYCNDMNYLLYYTFYLK
jgi:hypothetical protein